MKMSILERDSLPQQILTKKKLQSKNMSRIDHWSSSWEHIPTNFSVQDYVLSTWVVRCKFLLFIQCGTRVGIYVIEQNLRIRKWNNGPMMWKQKHLGRKKKRSQHSIRCKISPYILFLKQKQKHHSLNQMNRLRIGGFYQRHSNPRLKGPKHTIAIMK